MAAEEIERDREVLPLMEEALRVGKRRVEAGRVRVSVATETEERLVSEMLRSDRVEVERVGIGREVAPGESAPSVRNEDGVVVVPVLEEVLVVEKRLVLREEIRLRIAVSAEAVEQTIALRRQHAEVERLPPKGTAAAETAATEVVLVDRSPEKG